MDGLAVLADGRRDHLVTLPGGINDDRLAVFQGGNLAGRHIISGVNIPGLLNRPAIGRNITLVGVNMADDIRISGTRRRNHLALVGRNRSNLLAGQVGRVDRTPGLQRPSGVADCLRVLDNGVMNLPVARSGLAHVGVLTGDD